MVSSVGSGNMERGGCLEVEGKVGIRAGDCGG